MTQDEFNRAWDENSHGCGFAQKRDGRIYYKKGLMLLGDAWQEYEKLTLPFIFHWRKQSFGPVSPFLTHPYEISKDSELKLENTVDKVLFHNGTESDHLKYAAAANIYPSKDEITNDSHILAKIAANDNLRFLGTLNSKFAIADKDSDIFTYYGNFVEEDGIWFSNLIWRISHTVNHNHSKKKTQKNYSNFTTHSTNIYKKEYNYKKPWESNSESETLILRFLLNRITENAAKKLWNKYVKKKDIWIAQERAIKILKQQDKTFNSTKIENRIKHNKRLLEKEEPRITGEKKLLTLGELKDSNFTNTFTNTLDLTGVEIKDSISI